MKIRFEEKHIKWGLTAFLVVLCSIIVFFAIYRLRDVSEVINVILAILTPFIYGLVMAYLLCPIYNFTVRSIYALTKRVNVNIPRPLTVSKAVASLVSIIVLLVVITGILWMIIPGLVESIANIIQLLPDSMDSLRSWLDVKLVGWPEAQAVLNGWINNFTENAIAFVTEAAAGVQFHSGRYIRGRYGSLQCGEELFPGDNNMRVFPQQQGEFRCADEENNHGRIQQEGSR